MRGRTRTDWWGLVLEAPDGKQLARFYSDLFGWPIAKEDEGGAAIQVPGTSSYLAFDDSPDYEPPVWPAAAGKQRQMMHIDIAVDDLAAAMADAVELGATVAEFQPQDDVRVMLDPAGHPFCLYVDSDTVESSTVESSTVESSAGDASAGDASKGSQAPLSG